MKENLKSVRNQGFADRHKAERKLRKKALREGLMLEIPIDSAFNIEKKRAERRLRLEGVMIYRRDSVPKHSKSLIEERVDCA